MQKILKSFFTKDSPLERYASDVTSQYGEDGIIAHIMSVLKPAARYCVEFGAWDGRHYSNTYNLIQNQGWSGLLIEANAEKFYELMKTYAGNPRAGFANRFVDFEGPDSLDGILSECEVPKSFGLLSIDIDGCDYYVWESLRLFEPELVVIEFNPTVPNDVLFIQDKNFAINQGCSLLALVELGQQKGYELAVCTTTNAFFVKKEKFPALGVKSNFIGHLHTPPLDGRIFQGYDGSIHVVGMNYMPWRGGIPLSEEQFQIVPESERRWHDAQKKIDGHWPDR